MTKRKIEAYEGSGNVFADLGLPDPEERLLKSSIVTELHRLIKARDLTQVKAAKPALDYERIYTIPGWTGDQFVEAVYNDLSRAAATPARRATR